MQRFVKNASGYSLFFVMPGKRNDVHESAKKLIGVERIKEVLITEGDCGFVVRGRFCNWRQR